MNGNNGNKDIILIVDDEKDLREIYSLFLEKSGLESLAASSGEEATEIYKREHSRIGLVLLDLVMPGMTGEQTFKELKAIDEKVGVILISGYPADQNVNIMVKEGCLFFQKPISIPREILPKINEWLPKIQQEVLVLN